MHLYETFGKTANEVAKYFEISRVVDMAQNRDTHWARTRSLGRCMIGMAQVMHDLSPDIVLLLGDRSETLATAFSAIEMGIPVAHVQAGDVSGGLDDLHRHSITKLAHLHFSQTEKQGQRVLALGEEPWRVSVVGAPYVDRILANEYTKDHELLSNKYGLDVEKPFVLILQHSDTYHPDESYSQMVSILEAVSKTDFPAIVIYPCSDQGYQGVIDAISEVRGNSQFKIFNSIDSFDFLGLQSLSELIIGNSSAGVIEAPYFALPFVNVGSRQDRREKDVNVIEAGITVDSIMTAMEKGLNSKLRNNLRNALPVFGDGTANKKIYEILKNVELGKKLFHKRVIVERK
jgi:UDP-hydrolysing UDP-N-acetyl-D-glucosamine 2-epimerase